MSGIVKNFVVNQAESRLQDYGLDKWNVLAKDKLFKLKDPYRDLATGGRLSLPRELNPSKKDDKFFRKCQNKAWRDDKCFLSYFGFYMDCCLGIGMCPLIVLIPTIGPFLMYFVHNKLISMVQRERPGLLDMKTLGKMHANITFDLLISLPPVIGIFFTWINGCSTRNCVLVYDCLVRDLQMHAALLENNDMSIQQRVDRMKKESAKKEDHLQQSIPMQNMNENSYNSPSSKENIAGTPQAPSKMISKGYNNGFYQQQQQQQPVSSTLTANSPNDHTLRRIPTPGHHSDLMSH